MSITVRTLTNRAYTLEVCGNHPIKSVKRELEKKSEIGVERQRLLFNKTELADNATLNESGVEDGSILHVVLKRAGGGKKKKKSLRRRRKSKNKKSSKRRSKKTKRTRRRLRR